MPALIGLLLALVGPAVIAIAGKPPLTDGNPVLVHAASVLAVALVVIVVFVIATRIERIPFMRFGFAAVSWRTPVVAAVVALFFITVFGPLAYRPLAELGLGSFETGASVLAKLPRWYFLLTIVIVASAEELLYRAYAIERLAELTGSYLISSPAWKRSVPHQRCKTICLSFLRGCGAWIGRRKLRLLRGGSWVGCWAVV